MRAHMLARSLLSCCCTSACLLGSPALGSKDAHVCTFDLVLVLECFCCCLPPWCHSCALGTWQQ
eukprot:15399390-Alexandrium_andersonii.AAC.1